MGTVFSDTCQKLPEKAAGNSYYDDTNGVPLENGRVHHLGLKKGEVANRVVCVGSNSRALILKSLLDDPDNCFELRSPRGFTCYTGAYKGVRVSVMATGMGGPMMDFAVRESRAIVEGPMVAGPRGLTSPRVGRGRGARADPRRTRRRRPVVLGRRGTRGVAATLRPRSCGVAATRRPRSRDVAATRRPAASPRPVALDGIDAVGLPGGGFPNVRRS